MLVVSMLLLNFATPVAAGPGDVEMYWGPSTNEAAAAAYTRGNYATALKMSRELVDADQYRITAKGRATAQSSLGLMYANGRGVPQSYTEAAKWYDKAANNGDPLAQAFLGALYFSGQGVPQDYILAHKWFSLSSAQGNQKVADALGLIEMNMTTAEIASAQKLALEWKPTKQQP